MATDRKAEVTWRGDLMGGSGRIDSVTSGAFGGLDVDWRARSEDAGSKTSPEELIAAAHAACYAMSLASELSDAGSPPEHLDVRATVTLDQVEDGSHRIVASELLARARVIGVGQQTLERLAKSASEGCPFSRLIEASAQVTVNATLEGES